MIMVKRNGVRLSSAHLAPDSALLLPYFGKKDQRPDLQADRGQVGRHESTCRP